MAVELIIALSTVHNTTAADELLKDMVENDCVIDDAVEVLTDTIQNMADAGGVDVVSVRIRLEVTVV